MNMNDDANQRCAAAPPWRLRRVGTYSDGVPTWALIDPQNQERTYNTIRGFEKLLIELPAAIEAAKNADVG